VGADAGERHVSTSIRLDTRSGLSAILLIAIIAGGLMATGFVMNLVSLARSRRPSELGVRIMLAIPGLAILVVSVFGFVLFIALPEVGTPAFFAQLVLGLLLGSVILVGGLRARVPTTRAVTSPAAPVARRATWLLGLYLLPVGALELWGALSVRNNFRIGVATVSFASALVLLGVAAYARVVKLQAPVRFGSLDGSWLFLAMASVPLIGALYFLTSNLPDRVP
jgi:hypothetical protein